MVWNPKLGLGIVELSQTPDPNEKCLFYFIQSLVCGLLCSYLYYYYPGNRGSSKPWLWLNSRDFHMLNSKLSMLFPSFLKVLMKVGSISILTIMYIIRKKLPQSVGGSIQNCEINLHLIFLIVSSFFWFFTFRFDKISLLQHTSCTVLRDWKSTRLSVWSKIGVIWD